jgi:hypothetical protein
MILLAFQKVANELTDQLYPNNVVNARNTPIAAPRANSRRDRAA